MERETENLETRYQCLVKRQQYTLKMHEAAIHPPGLIHDSLMMRITEFSNLENEKLINDEEVSISVRLEAIQLDGACLKAIDNINEIWSDYDHTSREEETK